MPIIHMQRRLAEVGRIRIGAQVPIQSGPNAGKMRPAKLETFRLTSASQSTLEKVAAAYGGEIREWPDGPTGEQWELFTTSKELSVLVPPEDMAFSQWYEQWSGGGCVARCDGQYDEQRAQPCSCSPDPEYRACKPHTRLTVMIEEVAAQGMWRLDTQGYYAATEIGGSFEMAKLIAAQSHRSLLRGTLRLEAREVKKPKKPTRKFNVPVLQFDLSTAAGLTPLSPGEGPKSLGQALEELGEPPAPRKNAAEPVPSTGLTPAEARQDELEFQRGELQRFLDDLVPDAKAKVREAWKVADLPPIGKLMDLFEIEKALDVVSEASGVDYSTWLAEQG